MLSVSLNTIFEFVKSTPSSRNIQEGENIINSKFIISCGATQLCDTSADIYGLCLQTSNLSSEPHTIIGKFLFLNSEVKIQCMNCSCKAGAGETCKHIVAILLYCNRNDIKQLEVLSGTDIKCIWKQRKGVTAEKFKPLPSETFCCAKKQESLVLQPDLLSKVRCRLANCDEESAIAKHMYRKRLKPSSNSNPSPHSQNESSHPTCSSNFTDKILSKAYDSEEMKILTKVSVTTNDCCANTFKTNIACFDKREMEYRTRFSKFEWRKERQFRITGSRCYGLYTYKKDDWESKSFKYFWPSNNAVAKAMRQGIASEPVARTLYASSMNLEIQECGLLIAQDNDWLAFSPDGVVIKDGEPIALLEIKSPYELQNTAEETLLEKCKFLARDNNQLVLKKRHSYYAQIQVGMSVLNLPLCHFVLYSKEANSFRVLYVAYDETFTRQFLSKLKSVYFQKMLHVICKNKT